MSAGNRFRAARLSIEIDDKSFPPMSANQHQSNEPSNNADDDGKPDHVGVFKHEISRRLS